MGIFGNLGNTFTEIKSAMGHLLYSPFEANPVTALMKGSVVLVKDSVGAVSSSFFSFF